MPQSVGTEKELRTEIDRLTSSIKQLEKTKANLVALTENTDDFILFCDIDGKPLFFNSNYVDIIKQTLGIEMEVGVIPHSHLPQEQREYWDELHRRVLSGEKFSIEFPFAADGEQRYFEFHFNPVYVDGKIAGFSEVSREITERKIVEDEFQKRHSTLEKRLDQKAGELVEAERRFHEMFDKIDLPGVILGADHSIIFINDCLLDLSGCRREDATGDNFFDRFLSPREAEGIKNSIQKNSERLAANGFEAAINSCRESSPIIRWSITYLYGSDNSPAGLALIGSDVTKTRMREQQLRNALNDSDLRREEMGALFDAAKNILTPRGFNDKVRELFHRLCTLTGSRAGYFSLKGPTPDRQKIVLAEINGFSPPRANPGELPTKGPAQRVYAEGKTLIDNEFNNSSDAALPANDHFELENILFSPVILGGEVEGLFALANRPGGFGKSDARLVEGFADLAAIALRESRYYDRIILDEKRLQTLLDLNRLREGDFNDMANLVLESAIELTESEVGFIGFINKEQTLYKLHAWSSRTMYGCEIKNANYEFIVSESGLWGECVRKRAPIIINDYQKPHPYKHGYPEGHITIKRFIEAPVFDEDGRVFGLLAAANKKEEYNEADVRQLSLLLEGLYVHIRRQRDAEARHKLEQQLFHSQKMDAIGELAGGVAHDFNNLLTGILGYAHMLKRKAEPESKEYMAAETIEQAAERGSQLTSQLLNFARPGAPIDAPVNIKIVIAEVCRLLERTIDKNKKLICTCDVSRPVIIGDAGQLQQVLLNLAINARDAIEGAGEISFSVEITEIDADYSRRFRKCIPGKYLKISVTDTGCGIPSDIQERVFEPFFTTKERNKGAGMGLSMVYSIVKNHSGFVNIYSEVGHGSTVSVYLPYLSEQRYAAEVDDRNDSPIKGEGAILLIDDEAFVLNSVREMLRELGYDVFAFTDGRGAIEYYRKNHRRIDLAIIDMIMPEIDGEKCFELLREINPDVRAILSTGYALNGKAQHLIAEGMHGFIQKPYRLTQLSRVIAEALAPAKE